MDTLTDKNYYYSFGKYINREEMKAYRDRKVIEKDKEEERKRDRQTETRKIECNERDNKERLIQRDKKRQIDGNT